MMGLVRALYVEMMFSLVKPQVVLVSDLRMLMVLKALVWMALMCGVKVRWVSKVTPSIFGVLLRGMILS